MKVTIRYPPWPSILYGITFGLFLSVMFAPIAVAGDLDAFCEKNPTHHKCTPGGDGGNEGQFELTIDYDFDGATSTVIAIGTKHCDEQGHCNFKGDIPEGADPFLLPESLMKMLNNDPDGRDWKGTPIDAYSCFGTPPSADPAGRGVELARNTVDGGWFTAIGSYALDVDANVTRKYVFYFLCDYPPCDGWEEWEEFSMAGTFNGGVLLRIESPPKLDGKLKSTPCRCTISNDPSCPDEVVSLSITVDEKELD